MTKCGLLIAAGAILARSPFDVVARNWDQLPNFDHVENTFAKHPCRQVLVTVLRVEKMHIAGASAGRILLETKADLVVRIRASKDTSY